MKKYFNVNGACIPERHYMVNLDSRLQAIKRMIDAGEYFTINKARQYGKTTMLRALCAYLKPDYIVVNMDFQRMSALKFQTEQLFCAAFAEDFLRKLKAGNQIDCRIPEAFHAAFFGSNPEVAGLYELFRALSDLCAAADRPVVLIIDEVDTATNNQVFLDFLAQLRSYYLDRDVSPTFQSVILAGVYDIRNIRQKIRPGDDHKQNSPWNIAADFDIDMDFSVSDITGMLEQYEADCHTNMKTEELASLIYDYTSGYPFLVSRICKLIDEKLSRKDVSGNPKNVWTAEGVANAVKLLLSEKNSLFDSLIGRLNDYPNLKELIYLLLFQGKTISYSADDRATDMLLMFGFVKEKDGTLFIANRIFETRLYNYFLTLPEVQNGDMYKLALQYKNQFLCNGKLDMELILTKFTEYFDDIYGDQDACFLEEDGRRYFMLYLKPIINGTGNYYVEARTRNQERTDLIVDYLGEQYIIEMKIWRGNAYLERGEKQLAEYLDHYHLKKGYMLSFNFNKSKEIGVKKIRLGDKVLIEAVV